MRPSKERQEGDHALDLSVRGWDELNPWDMAPCQEGDVLDESASMDPSRMHSGPQEEVFPGSCVREETKIGMELVQ